MSTNLDTIKQLYQGDITRTIYRVGALLANELESLENTLGEGKGPWASVLYVDNVRGNDLTGVRGNMNRPFATIQAAVNAAQTDDTIQLAPQRFANAAAITIPATVVRIVFNGHERGGHSGSSSSTTGSGTVVRCATDWVFNLGTNLGLTKCVIQNMGIASGDATKGAIKADGSIYAAQTFLTVGLFLDSLEILTAGAPISMKYGTILRIRGCTMSGGLGFSITNVPVVTVRSSNSATMGWVFNYDITDPLSFQIQPTVRIEDYTTMGGQSSAGYIQIGGVYRMWVDQTSLLGGLKASATLPLAVSASPAASCGVATCGYFGGSGSGIIDFASAGLEIPDTATALVFDFKGTRFYGVGGAGLAVDGQSTLQFKVGGAAANFQTVQLDSTVLLPGKTVSAQSKIHITGRGARWPNVVLSTPSADGDIIPPQLNGTISLAAGGTVAQTWAGLGQASFVRAGAAPDSVNITSIVQGADTVVSVRSTTGFTTIATAQAGNTAADWVAIWK